MYACNSCSVDLCKDEESKAKPSLTRGLNPTYCDILKPLGIGCRMGWDGIDCGFSARSKEGYAVDSVGKHKDKVW